MFNINFFYNREAHNEAAEGLAYLESRIGDGITVSRWVSNPSTAKQRVIYIVHRGPRNSFASKQENILFRVEVEKRDRVRDELGLMEQVATYLLGLIVERGGEQERDTVVMDYYAMKNPVPAAEVLEELERPALSHGRRRAADVGEYTIAPGIFIMANRSGVAFAFTPDEAVTAAEGTRYEEYEQYGTKIAIFIYGMTQSIGYESDGRFYENHVATAKAAVIFNDEFTPKSPAVIAERDGTRYVSIDTWLNYVL